MGSVELEGKGVAVPTLGTKRNSRTMTLFGFGG